MGDLRSVHHQNRSVGGRLAGAMHLAPLTLLSQNRQADTDRIEAERDYEVNQRALRYLTILHRDAHS
jgi:uncharacterized membrane protein